MVSGGCIKPWKYAKERLERGVKLWTDQISRCRHLADLDMQCPIFGRARPQSGRPKFARPDSCYPAALVGGAGTDSLAFIYASVGALHNEAESAMLRLIRNLTQFETSTTCVSRLALNLPPF